MANSVEWLGVINGKPTVELDSWTVEELYDTSMGYLEAGRVSFGFEVDGMMNDTVYLCVIDNSQRKKWRWRYYPQSGSVQYETCVTGRRRTA